MTFFETIATASRAGNLRFLVIGGLAINFYGYSRETGDLDLLICCDGREQWLRLFSDLNYSVFRDSRSFLQLSPLEQGAWPVDLMLVRQGTFEPMFTAGRDVNLYDVQLRIPSLEHLLMLKLHALKHTRLSRFLKDFLDVEYLIRINKLDIKSENMGNYLRSMAQWSCMKKYPQHSPSSDSLNELPVLELPSDPNFDSRPPRIDHQVMLRRIAENIRWRNSRPDEAERRAAEKISAEFVL